MNSRRQRKVADLIHEELSDLLERKVADPRLIGVTVTAVDITPDLQVATVHYSVLGGSEEQAQAKAGLESARGFMRTAVAHAAQLRHAPQLAFRLDRSLAAGQHIEEILDSLGSDESPEGDESPESEEALESDE
jgi:ribosome-binding factor A